MTDPSVEEKKIRERVQSWGDLLRRKDVEAMVNDIYADDGVLMPSGAPMAQGRDAIVPAWKSILTMPNMDFTLNPGTIAVAQAGDMAINFGTYDLTFDAENGRVEAPGKYLSVWRKDGEHWHVVADMYNQNSKVAA
jgi:ketosteroid isomerase-like protein